MRILPHLHPIKAYKEHYAENYKQLQERREALAAQRQARQEKQNEDPKIVKYKIIGVVVLVVILGTMFVISIVLTGKFNKKEAEIEQLNAQIAVVNQRIASYEAISSADMTEQITSTCAWVVYLQNQYLSKEFTEDFEAYAARFLGNNNSDWSEGKELENPVWKGYIDHSGTFETEARMLLMLYDGKKPVATVKVVFELKNGGNIGTMTSMEKMWLT